MGQIFLNPRWNTFPKKRMKPFLIDINGMVTNGELKFDFEFDHCFGFYDNLRKYHDSKRSYELFVDIGEAPSSATVKGNHEGL